MASKIAALGMSLLLAGACKTASGPSRMDAQAREAAAVAAAMRQAQTAARDYKIAPEDLLDFSVYGETGLDRKARVDASGRIFLPLAGAVSVGGKSLEQARSLIEKKLSDFLVRPQVSLLIEQYGSRQIFVMGEVQKPGSYPMPAESKLTVLEAISLAGGFTPIAAQSRTRVLRYEAGQSVSYTIDVNAITGQGRTDRDMALEANDVVYVPESFF